jgi:tungstate transport system permease protein
VGRGRTVIESLLRAWGLVSSFDPELIQIVGLSLAVSLTATVVGMAVGAPLGGLLAISRFTGRRGVLVLVNGLMGLPPVVVGLAIYLLLSHSGPLDRHWPRPCSAPAPCPGRCCDTRGPWPDRA